MPWHHWQGVTESFLTDCQSICKDLGKRFLLGQRLLAACAVGDLVQVKLMLQDGAGVNMTSWRRTSPLMEATKAGELAVVNFLVTRLDLEMNKRDWLGRTTLHRAVLDGQVEMVRALLLASNKVMEVDTMDWKGNRLLDHLDDGEMKQMVWSRMVAEMMKGQFVEPLESQREISKEVLTVQTLRKEVEKIHGKVEDYEFEDPVPNEEMLEDGNASEMPTAEEEETQEMPTEEEAGVERKRKSGRVSSRTVRFRGS